MSNPLERVTGMTETTEVVDQCPKCGCVSGWAISIFRPRYVRQMIESTVGEECELEGNCHVKSVDVIHSPTKGDLDVIPEHLHLTCRTCGYVLRGEPCRDAEGKG
jgi:predicted nucleic-acid-binding Zn-ribbon protein